MTAKQDLQYLIQKQREHDAACHRDIYSLPSKARLTHLVLHFMKYAGKFASLPKWDVYANTQVASIITDTFIIGLSAADVLHVSADMILTEAKDSHHLFGAGTALYPQYFHIRYDPDRVLRLFVQPIGKMAKALESLDHLERFDYRQELEDGLVTIMQLCLIVAAGIEIHLRATVDERWKNIEEKQVT